MAVDAISFSAHADFEQTSGFVAALSPPHIVLVHGEAGEMMRLRAALERAGAGPGRPPRKLHTPRVVQTATIPLAPRRRAAVVGRLAEGAPKAGEPLRGVLVSRGRRDLVVHPEDLPVFTKLNTGRVTQKQARAGGVGGVFSFGRRGRTSLLVAWLLSGATARAGPAPPRALAAARRLRRPCRPSQPPSLLPSPRPRPAARPSPSPSPLPCCGSRWR
jgi:hypothetical protein